MKPSDQAPRASIPDGWRLYAIGDIHGRADLLDALLARIESDEGRGEKHQTLLVFLGDYIDRGPASNAVVERLIETMTRWKTICLKGNHEAFLLQFFSEPGLLENWARYGALNTLMSYGLRPPLQPKGAQCAEIAVELREAMPRPHQQFLKKLDLSLSFGDFFFVHAGARPRIALDAQKEDDLLWIREEFLEHEGMFEKIIVHGHTPMREPEILPNRINIDTGAYATGRLTCLVLEGQSMRFL